MTPKEIIAANKEGLITDRELAALFAQHYAEEGFSGDMTEDQKLSAALMILTNSVFTLSEQAKALDERITKLEAASADVG